MKIAKFVTLNIGLERNNGTGENTPHFTVHVLKQWGLEPSDYRVEVATHEYGIERTVVAIVPFIGDTELLNDAIYAAAVNLNQDYIAYAYEHNGELVGELVGPFADQWGKFEAEYFLPFDTAVIS